jgi:predicted nucleic acid-binding protein
MRPYFFDASAIVKLLVVEKGSAKVREFCSTSAMIRTTWLALAEAYGVLKRRRRQEKWGDSQYDKKIFDLQRYVQKRIKLHGPVDLPGPEFREVRKIQRHHNLDFSDALQIALLRFGFYAALTGDSRPVLVSADKKLLRAAKNENIVSWNPEKGTLPNGQHET